MTTPLLFSPAVDARLGFNLLIKAENLQRTGSFKFRGALNALLSLDEEARERGVVAYSSGNHAQGVAAAAQLLGIARHHRHAGGCAGDQGRQYQGLRRRDWCSTTATRKAARRLPDA